MSDINNVKAAIDQWMDSLGAGDLEGMIATCDPEVVICNEHQATTVGIDAVRAKYAPKIEQAHMDSGYDIQHIAIHKDTAMAVGHFTVDITMKETGDKQHVEGRLILVYQRLADGSWKLILDVDNND